MKIEIFLVLRMLRILGCILDISSTVSQGSCSFERRMLCSRFCGQVPRVHPGHESRGAVSGQVWHKLRVLFQAFVVLSYLPPTHATQRLTQGPFCGLSVGSVLDVLGTRRRVTLLCTAGVWRVAPSPGTRGPSHGVTFSSFFR